METNDIREWAVNLREHDDMGVDYNLVNLSEYHSSLVRNWGFPGTKDDARKILNLLAGLGT